MTGGGKDCNASTRGTRILFTVMVLCALVLIICLLIILLPYPAASQALDALTPDGKLEWLNLERHTFLRAVSAGLAVFLAVFGILGIVFRARTIAAIDRLISWLGSRFLLWIGNTGQFYKDLARAFTNWYVSLALVLLTTIAAILRIAFLQTPIRYDEAYSFLVFAQQPVRVILTDYHVPNNHIFHTLLMRAAYLVTGSQLWSIRLPVFLAGVLLVPVTFLVALQVFKKGKRTTTYASGLLASALVAVSTTLIDFSSNARGYMIICLFTMVSLGLALYMKARANRAAWTFFVLINALGFFTIPIFLFPFGMIMGWLFISWLAKDVSQGYAPRQFLKYWLAAGFLTVVFAFLLYLPLIRSSGLEALIGNRFVSAVESAGFNESILARIRATWSDWVQDIPRVGAMIMLVGFGLSLVINGRMSRLRIPFPLVGAAWIVAVVWVQRVTPWPRVWVFLLPIFLVWASGGLVWLAGRILTLLTPRIPGSPRVSPAAGLNTGILSICLLAVLLAASVYYSSSLLDRSQAWGKGVSLEQESARYLADDLKLDHGSSKEVFAVSIPANFPLRYYLSLEEIGDEALFRKTKTPQFERVLVVVHRGYGQTLEGVMKKTKLDEFVTPSQAELLREFNTLQVYEIDRP